MRRLQFLCLVFLLLMIVAGCKNSVPQGNYMDDLGRMVQINDVPQRIISLSPSNTELVYALGLQDRLIGVTTFCNYPPDALSKPKISEFSEVDIEKVVSLQPDLILGSSIHKAEIIPAFEKLNIPFLVVMSPDLDRLLADLDLLGRVTAKQKEASALEESLKQRIKNIETKTAGSSKPRVFFVTWHDPLWTAGRGSMIDDLIVKAGGVNIAADLEANQTINLETVIERNPEIIIVLSSHGSGEVSYNFLKNEPRFKTTDALKNNHVYQVDSDIFGRTTPRIVDGLEQMAGFIHPELFNQEP